MTRLGPAVVVLAAAGLAVLGGAPAARAADGGLAAVVTADDPLAPVLVLTNRGPAPCQVAAAALGPIAVSGVAQAGTAVPPMLFEPTFDEPLEDTVAGLLRTLAPGGSVRVPLPVLPIGPTGHAIEVVPWTGTTDPLGFLYPVRPDGPLTVAVSYSWPAGPGGTPMCGPGGGIGGGAGGAAGAASGGPARSAAGQVGSGGAVSRLRWLPWAAVAVGVPVGVLVVLVGRARLRRRGRPRHRGPAGMAALTAVVLVGVQCGQTRPAEARIGTSDPTLQGELAHCDTLLRQPGHDPAHLLPTLDAPGTRVTVVAPTRGSSGEGAASRSVIFIYWDPNDRHTYAGNGGNSDPCTTLYHELFHAWEDAQGSQDRRECIAAGQPTGIGINEVRATRAQNLLRAALGLPQRDHYGERPLPAGGCRPAQPDEPICTDQGCARSTGDPHLTTFDGRRYDFQAVGEFVAARDRAGGFELQVRQQPFPDSRLVAVNTAVAMNVAGDRVEVRLADAGLAVLVGGVVATGPQISLPHGGSVAVAAGSAGPLATVTWPDGSTAAVGATGGLALSLDVQPARARAGRLEGLFGDFNGVAADDVRSRGGPAVAGGLAEQPPFGSLYPGLADSWRVDPASALFSYPAGTTTASFTDRGFPDHPPAGGAPDRSAAEAVCRRRGVTDPATLADCALDVALTGWPGFADAAAAGQRFAVAAPGQAARVPGTADIYLAGPGPIGSLPGGAGTPPLRVPFAAGTPAISFPDVAGSVGPDGSGVHGADGGPQYGRTDITGLDGISGIRHRSRTLFLVGVFLPDRRAPAATPPTPDVSTSDTQLEYRPALGELFYVGAGRTPAGALRRFAVPAGATALYVGFADASTFAGPPGYYADNTGVLTVRAGPADR